jgi:hypothetical protein
MGINLCCPYELDIEAEIKKHPLVNSKGRRIKKDHLLFIIHCILQQRASRDDEHLKKLGKSNGFVPLHSKILESKIPGYRDCIEYLLKAGIIECDGKFIPEKVSKGYRLASPYRGKEIKRVEIKDYVLCRKIAKDKPFNRQNPAAKEFPYLAKWFETERLEIDEQSALKWINDLEASDLIKINLNKSYVPTKRIEEKELLFEKCRNYKILVSRIKEKDYFFHKDETGNRLHTNLTNLPKGLREFLTYDGQELVSIDIKNSQPYMSLPLLDKEFWQSKDVPGKPTLKRINREMYEKIGKNKKEKNNTIKFLDSSKSLVQLDIQKMKFVKNVIDGTFYEHLVDIFEGQQGLNLGNTEKEKRDKVKKMVLTLLFDDDKKIYNKEYNSPSQVFKRVFPSIGKIFGYVKKGDYRNLAILLQRIESYLLLDRICGRIAKERPFIPVFTIHDSIITTKGNEGYIQSIMKEELGKGIGKAPKFSVEFWQNQKLENVEAA